MEVLNKVRALLDPYLENGKYFVVDLTVSASKHNPTLTLLLDTDEGITIDEVALISRNLGNETAYQLEVSSPGVDFPLKTQRQFQKNIGRNLKLQLADGDKKAGKLVTVSPTGIEIFEEILRGKLKTVKKEATSLNYEQIKLAQVQVSFN
jgi:ribosome maturation factor RimP